MRPLMLCLCLLPLSGFAQAPSATAPVLAALQLQELAAFIGPFPAPDTEAGKADLAIVLWEQRIRTEPEIQRAKSEVKLDLSAYSEAMGVRMEAARFPETAKLFTRVAKDIKTQSDGLKAMFGRPRPYLTDARVQPAIERETNPSYPSGHATRGLAIALVLAELRPERREALLAQGRQVGVNRVIGGVHYPTDIEAGQKLGARLAQAWLAEPRNRQLLEAVRQAEWAPKP